MTIPPDTKDWTWVLTRPCPDCGLDAAHVRPTDVPGLVLANARSWSAVLVGLSSTGEPAEGSSGEVAEDHARWVRARPNPQVWSPLEYACHVRDVFRLFKIRLAWMLERDDPLFESWDQDVAAEQDNYALQDPAVVSAELAEAAAEIASGFEAVRPDQWPRTGRRSDGASFTVATFAQYFIHDPVHHLWDVTGRQAGSS